MAAAVAIIACTEIPQAPPQPDRGDLFGADDRKELFDYSRDHPYRSWAASTALVLTDADEDLPLVHLPPTDTWTLNRDTVETLGEEKDLCPGERFAEQPAPGGCSGFLVADDVLVTAGHCVDAADGPDVYEDACAHMQIVFGFGYELPPSSWWEITVPNADQYRCTEVIAAQDDDDLDYAILRLDRPVPHRAPLPYATVDDALIAGQPEVVIGHPHGLPTKITAGGVIESVSDTTIDAAVDTFAGNSGAPVFDEEGVVVALHVWRASRSHYRASDSDPDCYVPVSCTEDPDACYRRDGFPTHTRMSAIADLVP